MFRARLTDPSVLAFCSSFYHSHVIKHLGEAKKVDQSVSIKKGLILYMYALYKIHVMTYVCVFSFAPVAKNHTAGLVGRIHSSSSFSSGKF